MSLLFRVLFQWKCTSTHHKLALDALRHLRGDNAEQWVNLFLSRIEIYLNGSKAPDTEFKDFRNHVLHVQEDNWGGAVAAAQKWYDRTVEALRQEKWADAVYSAGVLSHYISDPFQPLHTAQSEPETQIHRAAEWSIARSYEILQNILVEDRGGYPELELPAGRDWLERLLTDGATAAHRHYQPLIDHYSLEKGSKRPLEGMDQQAKEIAAEMLGRAVIAYARVLEQAIKEAAVEPPRTLPIGLLGVLAQLTVPLFWVTRSMARREEQAAVRAIHREFKKTGRVRKQLPEEERVVRKAHAEEVLGLAVKDLATQEAAAAGTAYGAGAAERPAKRRPQTGAVGWRPKTKSPQLAIASTDASATAAEPATPRFYLNRDDAVVEAPSIGAQTAERLANIGVKTVDDFLKLNPESAAAQLNVGHITAGRIRLWQDQARFVLRVPSLRGHDAQILVGCGISTPEDLVSLEVPDVLELVAPFVESEDGQRIIRSSAPPDEAEVSLWINSARQARPLEAA